MVLWLLYLPFSILISVICYLTNPIAVLFSDDDGELHGFLKLWQTHDNSLNPQEVTEQPMVPKFLCYDWPRHYEEWKGTTPELAAQGKDRWFTTCIDSALSAVEVLQRYACRVYWLMRNCAYGWHFWPLGKLPGIDWKIEEQTDKKIYVHEDVPYWWFASAWKYKDESHWFSLFGYEVVKNFFIGWKVSESAKVDTRAMYAFRLWVKIRKEA